MYEGLCVEDKGPRDKGRRGGGGGVPVEFRDVHKGKENENEKEFVMPTETNVHGEALCFMVNTWAIHKTTEALLPNNCWRLAAVGGWRLAVGGPLELS